MQSATHVDAVTDVRLGVARSFFVSLAYSAVFDV